MGLNGLSRRAQFNFLIGLALEKNKNKIRAEEYYRKTLDIEVDSTGNDMEFLYYHGLALQKLGKLNEAKQLFDKMLSDVQKKKEGSAFFTQFERSQNKDYQIATNHYLTGLAYEGMGEKEKAKEEFANALKLNPGHIWSKIHLDSI
jgi:tetratricopeptide (TPR) repeat protein